MFDLFFIFSTLFLRTESRGKVFTELQSRGKVFTELFSECRR